MLQDANAVATLAVRDLRVAARFYEDTLGLTRADAEDNEAMILRAAIAGSMFIVPALPARTKRPL